MFKKLTIEITGFSNEAFCDGNYRTSGTSGISGNVGSAGTYVNITAGTGLTGGEYFLREKRMYTDIH